MPLNHVSQQPEEFERNQSIARSALTDTSFVALFCGAAQTPSAPNFDAHAAHRAVRVPFLPVDYEHAEVAYSQPSGKVFTDPGAESNGCGTRIHSGAVATRTGTGNVWRASSSGATEVVLALEDIYVRRTLKSCVAECGCRRGPVGCAVCGNTLGVLKSPCNTHANSDPSTFVYKFLPSAVSPAFPASPLHESSRSSTSTPTDYRDQLHTSTEDTNLPAAATRTASQPQAPVLYHTFPPPPPSAMTQNFIAAARHNVSMMRRRAEEQGVLAAVARLDAADRELAATVPVDGPQTHDSEEDDEIENGDEEDASQEELVDRDLAATVPVDEPQTDEQDDERQTDERDAPHEELVDRVHDPFRTLAMPRVFIPPAFMAASRTLGGRRVFLPPAIRRNPPSSS
ncbi:hypothetical protein C8R43DRAFT_1021465 [Mycena crocata]|nr:hypothetical protein C8R43DRAFT_1021465 [Mycena crocata]